MPTSTVRSHAASRRHTASRRVAMRRAPALALLLVPALLAGCSRPLQRRLPFAYESLALKLGAVPDCHERLGLHVTLRNSSGREIRSFRHTFHLFDEDGNPLGSFGANRVRSELQGDLAPGEAASYCSSLDHLFFFVPQESLQVGQYAVEALTFADGEEWRAGLRLPYYPYAVTSEEGTE